MRQLSRKAVVSAAAVATLVAGTTVASADTFGISDPLRSTTTSAQSASGTVTSADSFAFTYTAKRAKGADETEATGFFSGMATAGGTRLLKFAGPITCLHVKGSSVGFFYPVTSSDPAVVAMFGAGVFIYVDSDGKGNATAFSFVPVPAATTDGCYPVPGLFPATGKAVVKGG